MCDGKRFPALLARIPRDRVLTETDGPFVAVGGRKAEPSDVRAVVATLSRLWKLDEGEAAKLVYDNFARALGQAEVPSDRLSGAALAPA
jgi:TatD DNase family protein